MDESQARVFVVDDEPSVRGGLERLLRSAGYGAETFESAARYLAREPYHGLGCLVLDVQMPELDGLALQEQLSERGNELPIVFLTGHGDIPMSVQAMKQGAVDFLTKPVNDESLLSAVEAALERHREEVSRQLETADARRRVDSLTPRERQVMQFLLSGALNKQIAAELCIAEKTVKIHRAHVMKKMGARSVAALVRLGDLAGMRPESAT